MECKPYSTFANSIITRKGRRGAEELSLSPMELRRIHGFLFKGVLSHAGQYRTYNITKQQWILDGDTIGYGSAGSLSDLLTYDLIVKI